MVSSKENKSLSRRVRTLLKTVWADVDSKTVEHLQSIYWALFILILFFICIHWKSMKILETVVKWALHLGLRAHQKNLFNRKNVWALFVMSLSTISCLIYLCRYANTFSEYTYAVAAFSSMLVSTIIQAITIWKAPPLFECLDLVKKNSEESKCDTFSRIQFETMKLTNISS